MALLPGSDWAIQLVGKKIIILNTSSQEVILEGSANAKEIAKFQLDIHNNTSLNDEQKVFAHFWCGYFYRSSV